MKSYKYIYFKFVENMLIDVKFYILNYFIVIRGSARQKKKVNRKVSFDICLTSQ